MTNPIGLLPGMEDTVRRVCIGKYDASSPQRQALYNLKITPAQIGIDVGDLTATVIMRTKNVLAGCDPLHGLADPVKRAQRTLGKHWMAAPAAAPAAWGAAAGGLPGLLRTPGLRGWGVATRPAPAGKGTTTSRKPIGGPPNRGLRYGVVCGHRGHGASA